MTESTTSATRTIEITRVFAAPRALVYQAWLDPKHLVHWYHASGGWTTPHAETDPRPGGAFKIGFASPDGADDFDFEGTYIEVVEPERIVFTIADGRPVTITFTEAAGKTTLVLVLTLENENSEELQRDGWTEMLINLEAYLVAAA